MQTVFAHYFVVHSTDWQLPEAPLPFCHAPLDLAAVLRPLDAASWAEVPLAVQIENPRDAVVVLRLTLKRRKLPHHAFDPMSEIQANQCYWAYCSSRTERTLAWYGTHKTGAFIRVCGTSPKVRLRLPTDGREEVQ